jgi:hypothetical protein
MSNYIIPTAATVAVFVDGIHIDLLHRLDYKESQPKIPRYGYNDRFFSNVMSGRRLVQGFLAIVFVEPNYLLRVLERNKSRKLDTAVMDLANSRVEDLPNYTNDNEKRVRAEYIANLLFPVERSEETIYGGDKGFDVSYTKINKTSQESQAFSKRLIEKFSSGEIPMGQINDKDLHPLNKGGIDLDIYYLDPERTTWYVKLVNVEFDEITQTISGSGAEGSSEPLYEVYSFIARERKFIVRI